MSEQKVVRHCFLMWNDVIKIIIHYILMLDSEIPPRGQDSRSKNSTSGPRLTV